VFQLDRYLAGKEELRVPFRLSKGCFWKKCSFCRTRLPMIKYCQQPAYAHVYEKLVRVIEGSGIREFIFSDEAAHPALLEYIARRLIKDNIKIKWMTHTKVDKALTRERCRLYAASGCERIALGIETLNNRLLKLMKKGITAELVEVD
jgi:anaerobic magnesium-protoporphyrin IX monomethyl ester cyclase